MNPQNWLLIYYREDVHQGNYPKSIPTIIIIAVPITTNKSSILDNRNTLRKYYMDIFSLFSDFNLELGRVLVSFIAIVRSLGG